MKKNHFYWATIFLFFILAGFIVARQKRMENNRTARFYPLLERKGAITEEAKETRNTFKRLLELLKRNPEDTLSRLALVSLYIREARISGNHLYYDQAAMQHAEEVLKKYPSNFEALTFKSLLYLSQHHFTDGLACAEKAKQINPYNAFVYGLLVDAHVELGNYDAAIENADKMVSIRPDIRSYSRISYLREIFGDYPGAAEAMKMAIESAQPGDEGTEWCRVQLARLYENMGDWQSAAANYSAALAYRSLYVPALAGQGRIFLFRKEYQKAIDCYLSADSLMQDYSLKEQLAYSYEMSGRKDKADSIIDVMIAAMEEEAGEGNTNENIGHYADLELAYAYLLKSDESRALQHALAEYNRRPANIDVNEALAWVYYCKEDYKRAALHLQTALRTNNRKPALLCRAGLIYAKSGDTVKAKTFLTDGLKNNSLLPGNLGTESLAMLQK